MTCDECVNYVQKKQYLLVITREWRDDKDTIILKQIAQRIRVRHPGDLE